MSSAHMHLPSLRSGLLALLAAALFGVSMPLVQHFGVGLGAFTTAALLYAGTAAVGLLSRQRVDREARLLRSDLPRLLSMAAFGAVLGPASSMEGLTARLRLCQLLQRQCLFTGHYRTVAAL